jgi:hypothetical protein
MCTTEENRRVATHSHYPDDPSPSSLTMSLQGTYFDEGSIYPEDSSDIVYKSPNGVGSEADDDELSTTSGRRHGALLQPEEADLIIFEVSNVRVVYTM